MHVSTYCVPVHESPVLVPKLIQPQQLLLLLPEFFRVHLDILMNLSVFLQQDVLRLCCTYMWVYLAPDD